MTVQLSGRPGYRRGDIDPLPEAFARSASSRAINWVGRRR